MNYIVDDIWFVLYFTKLKVCWNIQIALFWPQITKKHRGEDRKFNHRIYLEEITVFVFYARTPLAHNNDRDRTWLIRFHHWQYIWNVTYITQHSSSSNQIMLSSPIELIFYISYQFNSQCVHFYHFDFFFRFGNSDNNLCNSQAHIMVPGHLCSLARHHFKIGKINRISLH